MSETTKVAFRLSNDLVARLDAYAEEMAQQNPGMKVTRSDAARTLMLKALAETNPQTETRKSASAKAKRKT